MPSTRHSVGMRVVDGLARRLGTKWQYNGRCLGYLAVAQVNSRQVVLLKPKMAMNLNGRSVVRAGKERLMLQGRFLLLEVTTAARVNYQPWSIFGWCTVADTLDCLTLIAGVNASRTILVKYTLVSVKSIFQAWCPLPWNHKVSCSWTSVRQRDETREINLWPHIRSFELADPIRSR